MLILFFERLNLFFQFFSILLLLSIGSYLSVRMGFFQFFKIGYGIRASFRAEKDAIGKVAPYKTLFTALAATIGTGNIVGVALAIKVGGPGAVFWMWVTAVLGMATKYSEVFLSIKYRVKDEEGEFLGGPMYIIKKGLGAKWKFLSIIFCISALVAVFTTGGMTHSNSISFLLFDTFSIARWITGLIVSILIGIVLIGGIKRVSDFATILVPIMSIFYFIACFGVLFIYYDRIVWAFYLIFSEAFTGSAVSGGFWGTLIAGIARGLYSNEAGQGSAGIAHCSASTRNPISQGCVAMLDCVIDTLIICTLTALVIIVSGSYLQGFVTPAAIALASFKDIYLGNYVLTVTLPIFALTSVVSWGYYGEVCVRYIKDDHNFVNIYRFVFLLFLFLGGIISDATIVWLLSVISSYFMMIPNIIVLIILSPLVITETTEFFHQKKDKI